MLIWNSTLELLPLALHVDIWSTTVLQSSAEDMKVEQG